MTRVLVIYDISDDELRRKVADALHGFGLARVQRSAFLGDLLSSRVKDLSARIYRMVRDRPGCNIQIYVLCKHCFARRVVIGKPTVDESEYEKAMIPPRRILEV